MMGSSSFPKFHQAMDILILEIDKSATMDKLVSLTHQGLSRLGVDPYFELKTDSEQSTIKCSRGQISFISPVISKLLINDPTVSEFKLMTNNSSKLCEILRSLLNGKPVTIKEDQISTFLSISLELGNEELLSFVDNKLTLNNVTEIVKIKYNVSLNIEREIEFIASHFHEFNQSKLSNLNLSIIDNILGSKSLSINNEHDILMFICDLVSTHGEEYRVLLGHLHIEYLEVNDIEIVVELIDDSNIGSLLSSVCKRLLCPIVYTPTNDEQKVKLVDISAPINKNKFKGIFSHLWRIAEGNPVQRKVINIEGESYSSNYQASDIIDQGKRNKINWDMLVTNAPTDYLVFDFKSKRISLTGYSIKSDECVGIGQSIVLALNVEGSNDKKSWTLIDKRTSKEFNASLEKQFSCKRSQLFRYIRIMMIGEWPYLVRSQLHVISKPLFTIYGIEFFGTLNL